MPPIDFKPYLLNLRQAHFAQKQIRYDLFLKGIVDKKWSKIQEKHIVNEKLGEKYNIVRWNKKLMKILLLHSVQCYKERCSIIAAESQNAYDQHTRERALVMFEDIRTNTWKIPPDSIHLLIRSKYFFENGNINNITEWMKNVRGAITRGNKKAKETATSIIKFFSCAKHVHLPKNRLIIEFMKSLAKKAASR